MVKHTGDIKCMCSEYSNLVISVGKSKTLVKFVFKCIQSGKYYSRHLCGPLILQGLTVEYRHFTAKKQIIVSYCLTQWDSLIQTNDW